MSDTPPQASPPPEPPRKRVDWASLRERAIAAAAATPGVKRLKLKSRTVIGVALGAGLATACAALFGLYVWAFSGLPRVPDQAALWAVNRAPGITFLDRNGETVAVRGPFYGQAVRLKDLPAHLPQAFLAIEDQRFYEHRGVDRQALARAAAANVTAGRTVQGGSTITQQLVKNLFLTPDRTFRRKVQEMILAGRVERQLTKDEILELYLNRIYLGDQAFGVDAAARRFFGKPASEVSIPEAAMLAGLPKAPSRSAPTENYAAAKGRQELVLAAMVEAGYISEAQRKTFAAEAVAIAPPAPPEGELGYAIDMAMEEAKRLLGAKMAPDLVVRLTIDPAMQREAVRVVREGVAAASGRGKKLQGALVAMDKDGHIRALVGGTAYAESKFNRAAQAKRQPGSTFKTFVYAAALEHGLTPNDVRYDEPIKIQGWEPKNYHEGFRGAVTLMTAFAQSLNTVAAEVADEVGQAEVARLATRMGITTPLQPVPSIALGSSEVTLVDMTQAFAGFMNDGLRVSGHVVLSITDTRGETLYVRPNSAPQRVYDEALNKRMTGMMARVLQNGTGTRAQLRGRDAAGKTGTSQDWRDAWFVGFTADYTAGVWLGHDDYTPMARITGGAAPAEIWAEFMSAVSKDLPARELCCIEPIVRTPRQTTMASFYDALTSAFDLGAESDGEAREEQDGM